jgi:mono/diheme cytochrome c family protein
MQGTKVASPTRMSKSRALPSATKAFHWGPVPTGTATAYAIILLGNAGACAAPGGAAGLDDGGVGRDPGYDSGFEAGGEPCTSAATCPANQICCGTSAMATACQDKGSPCPSVSPFGSVQLCDTTAECVTPGDACGIMISAIPVKVCGFSTEPSFGTPVTAKVPPPPLSGGTLLVTADSKLAVAADPDRDSVYVVSLANAAVTQTVALQPGDEPGRLVEDGSGRIHVALRGSGALETLDPATGAVVARRAVCPAPRGVAWDSSTDLVWVACATGELVALPSAGGAATHSVRLDRDLRDVVANSGSLWVTEFRSAEVLHLASDGTVARTDRLPGGAGAVDSFAPHVLWRAVPGPGGTVVAMHQGESTASFQTKTQGAYGGGNGTGSGCGPGVRLGGIDGGVLSDAGTVAVAAAPADAGTTRGAGLASDCSGPTNALSVAFPLGNCSGTAVASILTVLSSDGTPIVNTRFPATLPVDVTVSRDGSLVAAVAPGNAFVSGLPTVFTFTGCGAGVSMQHPGDVGSQPIAIAFDATNALVVQAREPARLSILGANGSVTSVVLSTISRADTGYDIFHTQAGASIACASCHPEGGDDGHVWLFDSQQRRTASLKGTIAGTAPYHWTGDEASLNVLVNDVYTVRMSGVSLDATLMDPLTAWVQGIPAPAAPSWVDASSAARGKALFDSTGVGCSGCHSGSKLTNNQTMNVGTGGAFQVPPLVGVGWRAPFLHNGCAASIADRFGKCSSAGHGSIGQLSTQDISDLTTYLETL